MTSPDQPSKTSYMVRLVMRVDGTPDEPESAVINFIEMMVQNGLRDWVYRVEDDDSKVLGYFDGYGDAVEMAPGQPTTVGETVANWTPAEADEPVSDDESLMALAESLNNEDSTPA